MAKKHEKKAKPGKKQAPEVKEPAPKKNNKPRVEMSTQRL